MYLDFRIVGQPTKIDTERLTATAESLAHAIAAAGDTVDIWVEADQPIRETVPDWELFYTADEASRGERRPWRGWSNTPLGDTDPHERLEHEAAKIPPGWHVAGAEPQRELTVDKVLAVLRRHGRDITPATWRSYVNRNQAPPPSKTVGRTPVWYLDDIEAWVRDPARRK
jgi:uncharacterized protein YbdZ (MbtH family)